MRNAVLNRSEPISEKTQASTADRWPYNPSTNIIDRDLAAAIRKWSLSVMSEADLNRLSQRQALRAYIDGYLVPTLDRVIGQQRSPEESLVAAKAVLDSGRLLGIPLDPSEAGGLAPREVA